MREGGANSTYILTLGARTSRGARTGGRERLEGGANGGRERLRGRELQSRGANVCLGRERLRRGANEWGARTSSRGRAQALDVGEIYIHIQLHASPS